MLSSNNFRAGLRSVREIPVRAGVGRAGFLAHRSADPRAREALGAIQALVFRPEAFLQGTRSARRKCRGRWLSPHVAALISLWVPHFAWTPGDSLGAHSAAYEVIKSQIP
jgi:hypothetical protein